MDKDALKQLKTRYRIIGNCDELDRALDVALQVAPTDLSVLIQGESGVGKEVLPRVIHDQSPRRREKYFAINCGSIPEGTIDSELFGHEKGAFTGAVGESDGYFGVANKGTLFLDEVGELPLATQARLLRVLETGEYIRVGGQTVRKTDVRIIAATNVNMRKAISEGRFREDLYYRLNTIQIQMPPLRDRGVDILSLFRFFAMQMTDKYRVPRIELTDDAKRLLLKYKWPGNIRQLKNVTEQICILAESSLVDAQTLRRYIPEDEESTEVRAFNSGNTSHTYDAERQYIFSFLFEMKNDIANLSNELHQLKQKLGMPTTQPSLPSPLSTPLSVPAQHPTIPGVVEDLPTSDNDYEEYQEYQEEPDTTSKQEPTQSPAQQQGGAASTYSQGNTPAPSSLNVASNERDLIVNALERCKGNRRKAAELLGISDRTLYRRLKEFNLV